MKKTLMLILLLLSFSLANRAQTLSKSQMTGWKAAGLFGEVKSVKYSTKEQVFFNTVGNPTKIVSSGGYVETRAYTTRQPSQHNDRLKITYGKNTRQVQDYINITEGGDGINDFFTFDNLGRIIIFEETQRYDTVTEEYEYNSNADKFPSAMKKSADFLEGSFEETQNYEYLTFDKVGNWTKRKVTKETKYIASDYADTGQVDETPSIQTEEYIETATYTYY